jgi:hypothetical protein
MPGAKGNREKQEARKLKKELNKKTEEFNRKQQSDYNKMKADKKKVWSDWNKKGVNISREKDAELKKGPKGLEKSKLQDISYFKNAVNDETRNANLQNIARNYNRKEGAFKYEEPLGKGKPSRYLTTRNKLRKDDPKIVGMKHGGKVKEMKHGGQACRGGGKATKGTKFTMR